MQRYKAKAGYNEHEKPWIATSTINLVNYKYTTKGKGVTKVGDNDEMRSISVYRSMNVCQAIPR